MSNEIVLEAYVEKRERVRAAPFQDITQAQALVHYLTNYDGSPWTLAATSEDDFGVTVGVEPNVVHLNRGDYVVESWDGAGFRHVDVVPWREFRAKWEKEK